MFIKNNATLLAFRIRLFNIILIVIFLFTLLIFVASLFSIIPLIEEYQIILFIYSIFNLLLVFLLKNNPSNFQLIVLSGTLSSIFTFSVMTVTNINDEFRIVWFILVSFGAFLFGGKKYGVNITISIISIILILHYTYDLNMSNLAIFTFISSIIIFNIFFYSFLVKIEHDENFFEERLKIEIEKRQTQENMLLRQHRMIQMGEMIDAIAHQWRQPLTASKFTLFNMNKILDDRPLDIEYQKEKIKELMDLINHMTQTIDDFRYLLADDKEKDYFNINTTIEEVKILMKSNIQDINIISNINNLNIFGFKNEFIQSIITIFHNAIEILDTKMIQKKELYIKTTEDKYFIYIHIEDNAGGIEELNLQKVFDQYFTTKKQTGGTGLGLYIAKLAIEQNMQGKLTVKNGKYGAIFTIKLSKEEKNNVKTI